MKELKTTEKRPMKKSLLLAICLFLSSPSIFSTPPTPPESKPLQILTNNPRLSAAIQKIKENPQNLPAIITTVQAPAPASLTAKLVSSKQYPENINTEELLFWQECHKELIELEADTESLLTSLKQYDAKLLASNGACAGSMIAAAAFLAKNSQPKTVRKISEKNFNEAKEAVNTAIDIANGFAYTAVRLLPVIVVAGSSWWGWRKFKNSLTEKYAEQYAAEVKKLDTTVQNNLTKIERRISTLQENEAEKRKKYEEKLEKRLSKQDVEIKQARENALNAMKNVTKITTELIDRMEKRDARRAEEHKKEQEALIGNITKYWDGMSNRLTGMEALVQTTNQSNKELAEKVSKTTPQFAHILTQLSALKNQSPIQEEPTSSTNQSKSKWRFWSKSGSLKTPLDTESSFLKENIPSSSHQRPASARPYCQQTPATNSAERPPPCEQNKLRPSSSQPGKRRNSLPPTLSSVPE